ncbi:NAD-dependent epimerase/dehydratase family protein [Enterococcus avium]|uniref:NAD-dependent epimerase/dehydratase family protein n=1 Tax=Enterococcus avium TaxID=33945 RepID=UPI003D14121F
MSMYAEQYLEFLDEVGTDSIYQEFQDKKFLITGATGMIGSFMVDILMRLNEKKNYRNEIYAMTRSLKRGKKRFSHYSESDQLHFIEQDVIDPLKSDVKFDYIIHAASNANPILYAKEPVETIYGNFIGMSNILKYSRTCINSRVLFVSSGEMYGLAESNDIDGFPEEYVGYIDYSNARSCYPSGKRSSEVLCQSYIEEYGVDALIVRPCHVYGPTMLDSDSRALSSFIRSAVHSEDIILKSKGEQVRSNCMVSDAVTGIFYVLLKGMTGEAYNISADESTYTIQNMAKLICSLSKQSLHFDIPSKEEVKGFSKIPVAILKNQKLKSLGWTSRLSFEEGVSKTIAILKNKEESNNG